MKNVLVLDVGTTGVKAFIFNWKLEQLSKAYEKYPVVSKKKGWVEQDPKRLLSASIRVMRQAVKQSRAPKASIASWGITNQRETTILWNKTTGEPVYPAIVWQDMRTSAFCSSLKKKWERKVRSKTGLVLDPYFSASKVRWILRNVPKSRTLASQKKLAFGTVDSWLAWHLCDGRPHITDMTNAARTLLMNIRTKKWDKTLLKLFGVPLTILPKIKPSASTFGALKKNILGIPLPLTAMVGDQQSSFYAATQTAKKKGKVTKVTFGTGTFVMQSLGPVFWTKKPFFTTLVPKGKHAEYALEAKVGVTGPEVERRLGKPLELQKYLYAVAHRVNKYIKRLPRKPKEIVIDGGVTQDPSVQWVIQGVTNIETAPMVMYDGTALGAAMLQLRH